MKVPFIDLKSQYNSIKDEVVKEINDVLDNTAYICGKKVNAFETDFAQMHNAKYSLGLSSGTDALHLAYWSLGIGIGGQISDGKLKESMDEVIVPVNTYIATTETISIAGAKPVFVDHEEESFNIDPAKIEDKITPRTKAIVAVHLYGQPANMDPIKEIADKHNLILLEDCSQAHFAEYKNRIIGTFGDVGTFSFYPGKNLGAYGEAGAVISNDQELYNKMLLFRQHGAAIKYTHEIEGHNYRMEEIQAGVLNVKLKYIKNWTDKRRAVAAKYRAALKDVPQVKVPAEMDYAKHVYHLFVIRVNDREKLSDYLNSKGIATGLHYPSPLHLLNAYKYLGYKAGDFPVAEKACNEILSIPIYAEMTDDQIEYVTNTISNYYKNAD